MTTIPVGTDLKTLNITLQKARTWDREVIGNNFAEEESNQITMEELFNGKRVAVVGMPAPFTGTCTNAHFPAYKVLQDDFLKSVDELVIYTVSDPYAHYSWAEKMGNDFNKITFLADPECEFAKEFGLDQDLKFASLGKRSSRFSMFVDDGIVKVFNLVDLVNEGTAAEDAENLLKLVEGDKKLMDPVMGAHVVLGKVEGLWC